jgi:rubrerythrin
VEKFFVAVIFDGKDLKNGLDLYSLGWICDWCNYIFKREINPVNIFPS